MSQAVKPGLPEDFCTRFRADFETVAEQALQAMETAPVRGVNLNRLKPMSAFAHREAISWNRYGRFIAEDFSPVLDPHWHAGNYYMMEPASQALDAVLRTLELGTDQPVALDLCAAPGGKSSVLLNVLDDDAVLVSNEIHRGRAQILTENAVKWGRANHLVCSADPQRLSDLGGRFDLVVVDAPCSGEGMFRKDPSARNEWSLEAVQQCALRQEAILDAAADLLVEGGYLVYSTCTFAEAENDGQVQRLLDAGGWEVHDFTLETSALRTRYGYQFIPGITPSEGLYIAVLRKIAPTIPAKKVKSSFFNPAVLPGSLPVSFDTAGRVVQSEERFWAMHPHVQAETEALRALRIPVMKAGIALGTRKGKSFLPDHELALYAGLVFNELVEFSLEESLNYLRGHAGRGDYGKGWSLVGFGGQPTGWMKGLGHRWNNLYPAAWRLRS